MQIITAAMTHNKMANKSLYVNDDGISHIVESDSDMFTIRDDKHNEIKLTNEQTDILLKTFLKHIRGEEICEIIHDLELEVDDRTLIKIIDEYADKKGVGSREIATDIIKKYL